MSLGDLPKLAVALDIGVAETLGGVGRFANFADVPSRELSRDRLSGDGLSIMDALHEAGLWNALQGVVFDISSTLPMDGPLGSVLAGMFGYQDAPTVSVLGAYVIYLVAALVMFFRSPPAPKVAQPSSVTNS